MWTILGTIAAILLIFSLMHLFGVESSPGSGQSVNPELAKLSLASLTSMPTSVKSALDDVMGQSLNTIIEMRGTPTGMASMSSRISKLMEPTTPAEKDPLLKIFDEL
jgi:hypothetical protein